MNILQPPGWAKPRGYANGIAARGTLVMIGGQVGWDPVASGAGGQGVWPARDFAGQTRQALDYYRKALDLSFRKGRANFDQNLVIQRVGQLSSRVEQ